MSNLNVSEMLAELNLSEEETQLTLQILQEYEESGNSKILTDLWKEDYDEIPVDIDTFLTDPYYLGEPGSGIWTFWRERFREIFPNNIDCPHKQVILTGSIGIGKSNTAVFGLCYILYRLMCLKDPKAYYGITTGEIVLAFINTTLTLSRGVAFNAVQELLLNSPWFMERGSVTGTKYHEYVPNKPIRFIIGSSPNHTLGKHVFAAMLDEVNFSRGSDVKLQQSKIMETYSGILERMNSRFMRGGKIPGCIFLVSSKKTEHDFLESFIRTEQGKPGVYIVDEPLWNVKSTNVYTGKRFKIAVGNLYLDSKIVAQGEDEIELQNQGYTIIDVPIEHYNEFELDMDKALMNIAGISVRHTTKFITHKSIDQCVVAGKKNPFTKEVLEIGLYDDLLIQDFFMPNRIPEEVEGKPVFIHIDTSLTGDKTGISATTVMGYKYINKYSIDDKKLIPTKQLYYKPIFNVAIKCPPNSEISLQKTRDFIYYLKHVIGLNIKGISVDGFQSSDTKQQLIISGFSNTKIISLDRKPDGYITLKTALVEGRIELFEDCELLKHELLNLERDNTSGKVDHPLNGSKDISDSLAGSLYNASMSEDELKLYLQDDIAIISEVNSTMYGNDKDALLDNMTHAMRNGSAKRPQPKKMSFPEELKRMISEYQQNQDASPETISEKEKLETEAKVSITPKVDDAEIRRRFEEAKRLQDAIPVRTTKWAEDTLQQKKDIQDGIIVI